MAIPYALDADEVQVGTPNGPGIMIADVGTGAPADTVAAWGAGWNVLGYLSEDGPTIGQDTSKEDLTPWQSISPIRSIITGRTVTLQFTLWQLNDLTLGLYFDADKPTPGVGGAIDMDVRSDEAGHEYAIGIDAKDGDRVLRVIFARATLSEAGDMPIGRGAAVPLDCTLTALEDSGVLAKVLLGPAS